MKLSVIVPVYNVEMYIKECLDSLIQQSLSDEEYEIICIDDGSTDLSGKIAEDYAEEYKQIKVFQQENKGVSAARNEGVRRAGGEYICFVDPDDYLSAGILGNLYKMAVKNNLDKLMYGYIRFKDGKKESPANKDSEKIEEKDIIFFKDGLEMEKSPITPDWKIVWNYLVRRTVIIKYNLQFLEGVSYFEDEEFNLWLNRCVADCGYIDREIYHYRQYGTSTLHTFMDDNHFEHYIQGRCKVAIYHKKILDNLIDGKSQNLRVPMGQKELEEMICYEIRKILSHLIYKADRNIFEHILQILTKENLYPYPVRLYHMGIDKTLLRFLFDCFTVLYPLEWYLRFCMMVRCRILKGFMVDYFD